MRGDPELPRIDSDIWWVYDTFAHLDSKSDKVKDLKNLFSPRDGGQVGVDLKLLRKAYYALNSIIQSAQGAMPSLNRLLSDYGDSDSD